MKESSRRWIFASVVAALILGLTFTNIDETKIYNALKSQLAQTGVIFNAKSLILSPMYMGSINLNDVIFKPMLSHCMLNKFQST